MTNHNLVHIIHAENASCLCVLVLFIDCYYVLHKFSESKNSFSQSMVGAPNIVHNRNKPCVTAMQLHCFILSTAERTKLKCLKRPGTSSSKCTRLIGTHCFQHSAWEVGHRSRFAMLGPLPYLILTNTRSLIQVVNIFYLSRWEHLFPYEIMDGATIGRPCQTAFFVQCRANSSRLMALGDQALPSLYRTPSPAPSFSVCRLFMEFHCMN